MSRAPSVLMIIPPGLGGTLALALRSGASAGIAAHHEATSGMGALVATRPPRVPFLYPPHTMAQCAAAVRAAGWQVALLDLEAAQRPPRTTAAGNPLRSALERITANRADVLAVLVSHGTAHSDRDFLRALRLSQRGSQRRVLLFGPSAHLVAGDWLAEGLADAALLGEPDGALAEALRETAAGATHDAHGATHDANGATHRAQGATIAAGSLRPDLYSPGGLLTDLDALPFPAWDAVDWRPYEAVSLLSSRGCSATCRYCAYTVAQGHWFRSQSPSRTIAELEWLAATIRPPRIQVRDPVFAHDRARVVAICEGILSRGIRVNFACESRPEQLDDELLRLLASAGCSTVKIGMESGDPRLLQRIGRAESLAAANLGISEVRRVAKSSRALSIQCQVYVMAGLPEQDEASLQRTRAALHHLPQETIIRAKAYQAHPETDLQAPTAPTMPETLTALEHENRPGRGIVRRALHRMRALAPTPRQLPSPAGERPTAAEEYGPSSQPGELDLAGRRVFLTGGNGFVGGYVAAALAAAGVDLVALVRGGSARGTLSALPVQIVDGDLREPQGWAEALRGCDLCFHVAAFHDPTQPEAMYAVNTDGTGALLAACVAAGVRRVVYTGTIGTVGRPDDARALPDEDTPFDLWEQASDYVKSKYLGELIAQRWAEIGLEVIVVKPTAPVGAGDGRPSATGRRILAALRGEATPYPPGGVNHVPVRDVAAGHMLAARRGVPGRTYILGHRHGNLDHASFLRMVAEVTGTGSVRVSVPARTGHLPVALTADPGRAIRELGMPQSDLRGAFAEAVAWYQHHAVERVAA